MDVSLPLLDFFNCECSSSADDFCEKTTPGRENGGKREVSEESFSQQRETRTAFVPGDKVSRGPAEKDCVGLRFIAASYVYEWGI